MADVDIHYINLASATGRRDTLEASFHTGNFPPSWTLSRFDAVNAASERVQNCPGSITPGLKANYLSHLDCIKRALASGRGAHALIAEDDTIFAELTHIWTNGLIAQLGDQPWDIIFLDAIIPDAVDMAWFFKLRYHCHREARIEVIHLKEYPRRYAGAGAYIIKNSSLAKVIGMCDRAVIDQPFDLYLRLLMHHDFLTGLMTFPFLTTVSELADASQVHDKPEDAYMNAFRRMVWMGAGPPDETPDASGDPAVTTEVAKFQPIFARLLTLQRGWHH